MNQPSHYTVDAILSQLLQWFSHLYLCLLPSLGEVTGVLGAGDNVVPASL